MIQLFSARRPTRSALWLTTLFFLTACTAVLSVPGDQQTPTDVDVAETGPGSLAVDVTDYAWAFLNDGAHIRITADVVNNTGGPIQSVIMRGVIHDQKGTPFAWGESYVSPTYLPPGGKGTIEIVAMSKKGRGVTSTRLITTAQRSSVY
ncbi:MAG: hypothetical protein LBU12_06865 [Deltaproteobacteria bacterium]|jgi:hypothetical protein|nr:hypothetical protein [Deltaproteobacteria bacterium]